MIIILVYWGDMAAGFAAIKWLWGTPEMTLKPFLQNYPDYTLLHLTIFTPLHSGVFNNMSNNSLDTKRLFPATTFQNSIPNRTWGQYHQWKNACWKRRRQEDISHKMPCSHPLRKSVRGFSMLSILMRSCTPPLWHSEGNCDVDVWIWMDILQN